jgi:hypothetical protein
MLEYHRYGDIGVSLEAPIRLVHVIDLVGVEFSTQCFSFYSPKKRRSPSRP